MYSKHFVMLSVLILLLSSLSVSGDPAGMACLRSIDLTDTNTNYKGNQSPLLPAPFIRLPLGSVQADGWLEHQLDLMVDGQVGHLEEISEFLNANSGWLGGDERGWEEAAYWLRGFYDLARLTGDKRLIKSADRWGKALIASQLDDGYYGSAYNHLVKGKDGQTIVDVWPQMVMNEVLISHYEATGDKRIIPMLTRFFAFCRDLPADQFLPQISWDYYENYNEHFGSWKPRIQMKRAGEFVPQLIWLYNQTGDKWMLDLAVKIYQKTQPAQNQWLDNHTVHFSQRFRYPAQMYPITGDERYLRKTELFYDTFYAAWGQMPRGAHAADERIRMGKIDPRQAIETCSMSELNLSHYILSRITGDTKYADRVEDMTFNHLPVSHRPDCRSIRYLTACNMPNSVPQMDYYNSGPHPVYAADMHRCCQHNNAMGWPRFVRNLWQASPDNGLVAWLYAPNTVTAKVGPAGSTVTIKSETLYPFRETIDMTVKTDKPTAFSLYLRIPGWCNAMTVTVAGQEKSFDDQAGGLVRIDRTWKQGDCVSIHFDAEVTVTQWPRNGAVTIDRGPLSYSVRIKAKWEKYPGGKLADQWPRWIATADSPWNYGLAINPDAAAKDIAVTQVEMTDPQPWQETAAPIVLKVPAKRIPDWKSSIKNTVDSVREGPVRSDQPLETIEMIPMGCAHLRMSVLPVISDRADARYWKDIPNPDEFMLERLTH